MSDENKDPELQTWIDPELEARVVAWVLGEASDFEAAELARIVAGKPELQIFKRRIEAVHGLVAAASRMELDPIRMSEERRRKLIETLGRKETAGQPALVAMPQKEANAGNRSMRTWAIGIAAGVAILALLASIAMPSFSNVGIKAAAANKLGAAIFAEIASAQQNAQVAAPRAVAQNMQTRIPAQNERLAALDSLKALASNQRDGDGQEAPFNAASDQYESRDYAGARTESQSGLDSASEQWNVHKFGVKGTESSNSTTEAGNTKDITNKNNSDELITKEYQISAADVSSLSAPTARGGGGGAAGAGSQMGVTQASSDIWTANGVQLPAGASAQYDPQTGRLIVHNTAANIERTDAVLNKANEMYVNRELAASIGMVKRAVVDADSAGESAPAPVSLPASETATAKSAPANGEATGALAAAAAPAPAGPVDNLSDAATVAPAAAPPPPAQSAMLPGQMLKDKTADFGMAAAASPTGNTTPTAQLAFSGPLGGLSRVQADASRAAILGQNQVENAHVAKTNGPMRQPAPQDEVSAADQPYSTFSLHVSDVSFLLASAELANGQMPDPNSIRPEEFYNAFDYGDPAPGAGEKIACHVEQAAHPVLQQRNLVRIAMKVAATGRGQGQPLRLTVLLDTSGSMEREDRAASVQRAMQVLTSLLGPNDAVTLIGFARQPRLLAEEVPGDQAGKLAGIVKHTPAEGGTNMEEAIKTASELALRHFESGGQNRVVMLTDGAANLGNADPVQLSKLVDQLRQQGVSFDACGVGANGLDDDILEALTRKGGGRYYFLNKPEDADEGFARQLAGAFRPAAENVKMQVRFNPDRVGKYRLIGFEKHRLNQEDFRNDKVTAAQLAAEEAAVALYQVQVLPEGDGEIGEVFVRFRDPSDGRMVEQSWTIPYDPQAPALDKASPAMQLAATSSLVAEKLRGGPLADALDLDALEPVVTQLRGDYAQQARVQDFANMFEQVRRMTARK